MVFIGLDHKACISAEGTCLPGVGWRVLEMFGPRIGQFSTEALVLESPIPIDRRQRGSCWIWTRWNDHFSFEAIDGSKRPLVCWLYNVDLYKGLRIMYIFLFHMCTDITDEEWLSILNKIIQWRFLRNPGFNNLAARFSMQMGSFGSWVLTQ